MRKIKVKLNTTLKGIETFMNGSIFSGPIHELPIDIQKAVEEKAPYLSITELEEEIVAEVKQERLVPQPPPVQISTESADAGETTPDEENAVEEEIEPPAKAPVKRRRTKRILKPKE